MPLPDRPATATPSALLQRLIPDNLVPLRNGVTVWWSNIKREGEWILPRTFRVFTFMGNAELDLTWARMGEGVSEIEIRCILGNVEIKVHRTFAYNAMATASQETSRWNALAKSRCRAKTHQPSASSEQPTSAACRLKSWDTSDQAGKTNSSHDGSRSTVNQAPELGSRISANSLHRVESAPPDSTIH